MLTAELSSLKTETTAIVETTPITESTAMARSTTPQLTQPWELNYRLPSDTLPLHYEIYLHPDLTSGTFTGNVAIHLNITQPRDFILIHIKYLTISSTSVHKGIESNGEQISLGDIFEYAPNEFWVVKLRSGIQPGLYTVNMDFTGSLVKDIVGFYKSNYYNSDTNKTRYIVTKMYSFLIILIYFTVSLEQLLQANLSQLMPGELFLAWTSQVIRLHLV